MNNKRGKSLCLFSAKGGVGKTVTTINLAGIFKIVEKKVLIIDLNLSSGGISIALNKPAEKSIYNLVDDYENNRHFDFKNYVTHYDEDIDILASPKDPRQAAKIDSKYIDLIIFDVKHTDPKSYEQLTGFPITESLNFLKVANKLNKKFWIRQVIVPGMMDNTTYLESLKEFLKNINNIEKIEFLPYHKLGSEKYIKLGISNSYKDMPEMDKEKCSKLYNEFKELLNNK